MLPAISHKHKCIFIHIPKTAGTSIESLGIFDDFQNLSNEKVGGHKTAIEVRNEYSAEFNDYFKFCFVRNPWSRLLSAYIYLKNGGGNVKDKEIAENLLSKYSNFDEFCIGLKNDNLITEIIHLKPQYEFIYDSEGNALVDYIGKLESIDNDFTIICNKISYTSALRHERKTKHKHYSTYYTEKSKEIVASVYKKDIELFNYNFQRQNISDALLDNINELKILCCRIKNKFNNT